MELHIVSIPFVGDYDKLVKQLRLDEELEVEFKEIYDKCVQIARPKGVYGRCEVSQQDSETFVGGHAFDSRVMSVNFKAVTSAYPYVMSCGRELYDYAQEKDDPLEKYWIDSYSEQALREVGMIIHKEVINRYDLGHVNSMNPGSLVDFPISCQRPLFDLLGDGPDEVGVKLTDTFLMLPYKAGSGIYYESDKHFVSCSLCPRENCPNRRAKFSEKLFREDYNLHAM